MSSDRDFAAQHLAEVDQWHAAVTTKADELLAQIRADTAADEPASEAVNTWLLSRGLQRGEFGREHLADLAALLLIRALKERA